MRNEREISGIRMAWEEHGAGLPVVLLHGIPTGPALWRHVGPRVSGVRLLSWEMVGYADSIPEGRSRDISVSAQADYLAHWLDALGLERVVLAGHDLGGGVAHILAVRHRARCAGLLLTNCIGYDSWPIPSVKMLRAMGGVVRRLPDAAVKNGVFRVLMHRGHDDARVATQSLDHHWAPYARENAGEALIRQVRALHVGDTLAAAADVPLLRGTPARVIWGAADQFQKVEYGARFAHDLAVPLERIEGGKHFTPEDHPDRVAATLQSLVDEVAAHGTA